MQPFSYTALPGKVVFGSGTLARVADEIRALGCSRALLLSTPQQMGQVEKLRAQLGDLAVGLFSDATMHTPVDVTERAMAMATETRADCVVALGGGSTTGLGKAIAVRTDLPQIVIPTTYAGSEATPILGETKDGLKTTQRNMKILPEVIIYDVDLTLTLPVGMTVTSGMNGIAHAAEGLYAQDANPIITMIAEDGVRAIARSLPAIVADPSDIEARGDALYGAWACGVTLGAVGMSLHHKLCHTLGGTFDLPHAETHTVVLPHAMAYNAPAAPEAMKRLARAIGAPNAPQGLWDMTKDLGGPVALKDLGMPEDGLDKVVELALSNPYWNPRPLEREPMRAMLQNAWAGVRPPEAY
jgi:alcohol dehydrogenase class IV